MRALTGWFTDFPIADPIERRLAPIVLAVLCVAPLAVMQALLVLATATTLSGPVILRVCVNAVIGSSCTAGAVLVKQGRFRSGVTLASLGFVAAIGVGTLALGLYEHRMQLSLFVLPLAFLGLLLDRRWLLVGVAASVAIAISGALLEPGFLRDTPPAPRGALLLTVTSFISVTVALAVLCDRFRETMRAALSAAHERQRELQEARASLEARTSELVRINDDMQREMAERRRLEDELVHAQKMDSIGRLAGGVAHDFNNLLTVIVGYAETLRMSMPPGHPAQADAVEILEASMRAADLTKQLLVFARRQTMEVHDVDVNEVAGHAEKLMRRAMGDDVEIVVRTAPQPAFVNGDASQLQQVLLNLAVNARDAMPDGGTLTITVDTEVSGGSAFVVVTVHDTGRGIDAAVLPHVFEPFFTTKDVGEGTGLGLPSCFGIVTQHGGRIDIDSTPGAGTIVRIYLPQLAIGADAAQPAAAAEAEALPRGRESILLVEDESRVRQIAAEVLRGQGYDVVEAGDGDEALRIAAGLAPGRLDLLVTDLLMPRMRGSEVAARVRLAHPDIHVLFISGYADATGPTIVSGASQPPFLSKPFTPAALATRVRQVLDDGAPSVP